MALLFLLLGTFPVAAEDLARLVEMIRGGNVAEARPKLVAAVKEYRTKGDAPKEGAALLLLAFADVQSRDLTAARANMQAAAEKFETTNDFFSAWLARLYLACMEMGDENWAAAVKHHEAALVVLKNAESSTATFSFDAVMVMGPLLGMQTAGFEMFKSQPELIKSPLLRMAETMSLATLGKSLIGLREYDRAERELTRAGERSAMFFGMFDGVIAEYWGDLRRKQQRYDEAREHYRKALDLVGRMPLPGSLEPAELSALRHLAEIESLSGRLTEALAWNDRALAFVRERNERLREASVLDNRSGLFLSANRFDEARQVLEQAWKIIEKEGDARTRAAMLTSIGQVEVLRGRYGAAAVAIGQAIDLYNGIDDPWGETGAWLSLATVYIGMRAYDSLDHVVEKVRERGAKTGWLPFQRLPEMIAAYRKAMTGQGTFEEAVRMQDSILTSPEMDMAPETLEIIRRGSQFLRNRPDLFSLLSASSDRGTAGNSGLAITEEMAYIFDGAALYFRGELEASRAVLRKALDLTANSDLRAVSHLLIAATWSQDRNYEEASRELKRATDMIDDDAGSIGDEELLARYLGEDRQGYFAVAVDVLARSNNPEEAFAYAERARSRAFLRSVGNRRIAPRRGSADLLVQEAESLRLEIAALNKDAQEIEVKRNRYRALLRLLKTSNPEYASLTRIEPLSLNTVRAQLPTDTTLVSYFLAATNAHVWIVDRDTCEHVQLSVPLDTWKRLICWSSRLRTGGRGAKVVTETCSDQATAEEAFNVLFAPLRDRIRHRRLILIPHGILHQIPFAALRDPKSGRYLIEDYTLLFAPSASTLPFLREKETPVTGSALVLGDPDGSLGNLHGAQREALSVARDFGTTALIGAEAKESLLYQLDGSVDLLHIGAHGEYSAKNPLFSRIALAPGDGHDGELEVDEILNRIDLRGVNLVVLSACRTAVGERSGGDDVVGLTRAVLYAGSPGVISTLWDIDDDAAAVLMEELYCRLLDGAAVADALRAAQLRLLHSDVYGDPRYWGAFLLTGDPQGRFNGLGAR